MEVVLNHISHASENKLALLRVKISLFGLAPGFQFLNLKLLSLHTLQAECFVITLLCSIIKVNIRCRKYFNKSFSSSLLWPYLQLSKPPVAELLQGPECSFISRLMQSPPHVMGGWVREVK